MSTRALPFLARMLNWSTVGLYHWPALSRLAQLRVRRQPCVLHFVLVLTDRIASPGMVTIHARDAFHSLYISPLKEPALLDAVGHIQPSFA